MSKWSEYVDIYDVRMQRDFRRERNEALDLLESIPKAGSLDWSLDSQEWADRSNALLDRLREPEREKTVRELVDAYESGKKFSERVPLQILADAIDELRQK